MNLDIDKIISAGKWVGGVIGWIITNVFTYRRGRKAKIDDIQITKRHQFAEQIAEILQKDFYNRKMLKNGYHENFDHMENFNAAMDSFSKYETLYVSMKELIPTLSIDIAQLQTLNMKAAIYLNKATTKDIEDYIEATRFTFHHDGIGIINTFYESFFQNLLDEERFKKLNISYDKSISHLRKAVK
ncbi:MAG: hypothetical protein WA666_01885 [Nitrospirota bacterium]